MRCAAGVLALALVAAASEGEDPPKPKETELGKPFELKPGETAVVASTSLRVTVDGVRQDSRCPVGVQCIWEGDAEVEVTLERPPAARVTRVLHTNGRFEREATYEGLKVRLKDVTPYPREGRTIAPKDNRVTLVVDKV